MSARTSRATAGRPGLCRRLFQVQKSLKPDRCHRITVAGWTTETASVQPRHRRDSRTQNSRSAGPQPWTRRGALEDGQLVPQREVLEHQGALGPDPAEEAGEDEGDHAGHHRSGRPKVNVDETDGVSRRHTISAASCARISPTTTPRGHTSLDNNSTQPREVHPPDLGRVVSIPQVGGLHHRYQRAA